MSEERARTRASLTWAWGHVRPYLMRLLAIGGLGMIATGAGLIAPLLIVRVWDDVLIGGQLDSLWWLLGLLVFLSAIGFALTLIVTYFYTRLSARVLVDMRLALFRRLLDQPAAFFTMQPAGDLHARLSGDVADLQSFVVDVPVAALRNVLLVIGSLALMLYLSPPLLLVALAPIPLAMFAVFLARKRVTESTRAVRDRGGEISSVLVESLTGAGFFKAFGLETWQARRFFAQNRKMIAEVVRMQMLATVAGGLPDLILRLGSLAVLGAGAVMLTQGELSAGTLIGVGMYQVGLFRPVSSLFGMVVRFQQARAAMDRVHWVLERMPQAAEQSDARPAPPLAGRVEFAGVEFSYAGADRPALAGIDLIVPAGSSCAVLGPTGAGKTSLVGLLLRTHDPSRGKVMVDGHDLRALRRASYLRQVGVVTQETFLLNASLEENLRCVRPRASVEEIEKAIAIADLGALVARLPDGLSTMVGERGARLSGGERQRLAIARAVLKQPRILILDEATSALDWDTDRRVRDAIATLMQGRTTLVVTHRIFTVGNLDQIVLIEDGRIVEAGDPDALGQSSGRYAALLARAAGEVRGGARGGALSEAQSGAQSGARGGVERAVSESAPRVVRVGVIDSGVNFGHPHVGVVAGGVSFTGRDDADALVDRVGHGTPVAAVLRWLAPAVEIHSYKVMDSGFMTTTSLVARAVERAAADGMEVLCLALGSPLLDAGAKELERACDAACARGVIVVAAARSDEEVVPAAFASVIGVLRDDRLGEDEIAMRSGARIPFAASGRPRPIPGVPIELNLRGPSFAAPRVAAMIARILVATPGLTLQEVRAQLSRLAVSPGNE